ncbi:response regulator [Candidatus Woesearchaeota archaeon]|nr:response regulator [Candidatus Woesearchaeota archaeon]
MVKNVIVADDRENWRKMYVAVLSSAFPDVHIDEVETGSDLVKRVLEGNYSVVISDNDMESRNNGLEALQQIRLSGNNVPFYLVSAKGSAVERDAISYGATCFYNKVLFDSDKLIADITQYLGKN